MHKEISAIFDGVPLPNRKDSENPSVTTTADRSTGHIPPRPSVPPSETQKPAVPPQPAPAKAQPKPKPSPEPVGTGRAVNAAKPVSAGKPSKSGSTGQLGMFLQGLKDKVLTPPEGVSQSKHMMTVALIPILFVVVLVVFGRMFIKPSGVSGGPQTAGATTMAASVKDKIDWKVPAPYPTDLRDPMTRVPIGSGADTTVAGDLQVKGIVYSSDSPTAIIGTQIVSEGDTVFGATILNINKDSVEFRKDGKKWTQKVQY